MEKKKITVVSLDPRAGASYAKDVRGLFGDMRMSPCST